jgi:hypothetical protein
MLDTTGMWWWRIAGSRVIVFHWTLARTTSMDPEISQDGPPGFIPLNFFFHKGGDVFFPLHCLWP